MILTVLFFGIVASPQHEVAHDAMLARVQTCHALRQQAQEERAHFQDQAAQSLWQSIENMYIAYKQPDMLRECTQKAILDATLHAYERGLLEQAHAIQGRLYGYFGSMTVNPDEVAPAVRLLFEQEQQRIEHADHVQPTPILFPPATPSPRLKRGFENVQFMDALPLGIAQMHQGRYVIGSAAIFTQAAAAAWVGYAAYNLQHAGRNTDNKDLLQTQMLASTNALIGIMLFWAIEGAIHAYSQDTAR